MAATDAKHPADPAADRSAVRAPAPRYTLTAIGLHWLLALLILGTIGLGLVMTDLPLSPTRLRLYNQHKWAGATVLALTLLRLGWRLGHRPPPLQLAGWQRRAAPATHALLYGLALAVPLVGWAYSSAAGFPLVWFGVLPLPDWVPVDRELAAVLKLAHRALAYALAALVALHVAAALHHQFILRDGLLRRMWPSRAS
jgi:cytochrome b561